MKKNLSVQAITTRIFSAGEDLFAFVVQALGENRLGEGDVLVVTSKVVSLAENRTVLLSDTDKLSLVKREADVYIAESDHGCHLTVKHGLVIPSAGIDESNAEGPYYILYPKDPFRSARELCQQLKKHYSLQELGVLITDSHITPLRRGVTGISLSHWGFVGVQDRIGSRDLFGRPLRMTQINAADALAAAAVFLMGEADESTPLALIQGASVRFTEQVQQPDECHIPIKEDFFFRSLRLTYDLGHLEEGTSHLSIC